MRRYRDIDPLLELCVRAQKWYRQESIPTMVKACATMGVDELLQLAGVDAITIIPGDLKELRSTDRFEKEVKALSMFDNTSTVREKLSYPSYIDDEARYRMEFDAAEDGKAQLKLSQVRINGHTDYLEGTGLMLNSMV